MPAFQRLIRHPWALGLLGILSVLLMWWITTASGSVNKLVLPSPQAVWQAGQQQWTSGLLLKDANNGHLESRFAVRLAYLQPDWCHRLVFEVDTL